MPAQWMPRHWPRCTHHAFLSHCAEDRIRLVGPVNDLLAQHQVIGWIDERNYPAGRDPFEVLREELIRCRHIVYFVTAPFLKQGRGWTGIEKGIGAIIQQSLWYGTGEVCHIELPLFFVPQNHPLLARSAYAAIRHKGLFYPRGRVDSSAVAWAAQQIRDFIDQEQAWATVMGTDFDNDPLIQAHFHSEPHIERRIKALDP